jgi:hypothetical protein
MSRLDVEEPVSVRIGDCLCANTPHDDGDFVLLAPQLSLDGGLSASGALASWDPTQQGHGDRIRLERELGLSMISGGVIGWNFLDDAGKPIPVTPENIVRALPWDKGGRIVAERANDLYGPAVLAPLVEALRKLSSNGQTGSSTSATRPRKAGTRKPRALSSPATAAGPKSTP